MIAGHQSWRVRSDDRVWHRPAWYTFHYQEGRNENGTYCGLVLNDPPFLDLAPRLYRAPEAGADPRPACDECEARFRGFLPPATFGEAELDTELLREAMRIVLREQSDPEALPEIVRVYAELRAAK